MAMSSPKAANNTQRQQHDVFIGLSCKETRESFVSHLAAAFRRRGISVHLGDGDDDEDTPSVSEGNSQTIQTQIQKKTRAAVKRSRVCVVVFSPNFAFSRQCLNSLLQVHDNSQVVVPVFYGVTRTEVLEQTGRFAEALSEHQRSAGDADRVAKWRQALVETASLKGHEQNEELSDSKLVEMIAADVHEKLFPTDRIGIYSRLVEIENLLCKQPWGVRSIGIWGMGDVGKTTIAEAIFNQMKRDYEGFCFIRDFDRAFHEKGVYRLREESLPAILREKLDINRIQTKEEAHDTRALVVLNDVHNAIDVESFLGGFDWFHPGSVIIMTSMDKQVLVQCRVNQIYEVKGLNESEATQLFCRYAFGEDKTAEKLPEPAREVIEYADGNPAALSFYGRELKGMEPKEMDIAFRELKRNPPNEILKVFKRSYDELSDSEKNIFLDIACFFRGEKVNSVTRVLEGCGFFPLLGIEILVEKSLVKISESRVQMHNLIRDVARKMVEEESSWIGRGQRLWDASLIRSLLEDEEGKAREEAPGIEDVESIFLDTSGLSFVVNPAALENMYSLRLLKIHSSDPENNPGLEFRKDLESLPSELRLLHWENYPLESLPQDFDPRNLVELDMPYSQLQKLWEGTKELEMLRMIKLCHSRKLAEIEHICRARELELIDLRGCTSLQSFPDTGHLENLRVLNLSGCTGIARFPEVPVAIEELCLEGTGITEIPASVESLVGLVKLDLGSCVELKNFLIRIYKMKSLELLNLSGCKELKSFPDILEKMENLRYLYLNGTAIEELRPSATKMVGLKVLAVSRNLKIPHSMKELKNLKVECYENAEASSR